MSKVHSKTFRNIALLKAQAIFLLFWLIHITLRTLQLGRTAPYGQPFVEKFDWYIFHAVCYDTLVHLPILGLVVAFLGFPFVYRRRSVRRGILLGFTLFLALWSSLSALDHEMMRFLSLHGSISQFQTYIGVETTRDLPTLLSTDQGGWLTPFFTVLGSGTLLLTVSRLFTRYYLRSRPQLARGLILWLAFGVFSYAFLFHIWKGGFRLYKLRPLVVSLYLELLALNLQFLDGVPIFYQLEYPV